MGALTYRDLMGMGQAPGNMDLDPPPEGLPGQPGMTTMSATTVFSRPAPRAPVQRRSNLTSQVEELEYLVAGAPNVSPVVLAQKLSSIRRQLMGSSDWSYADYSTGRGRRYDSRGDLLRRVERIERLLGVAGISPRLAMTGGYGLGAISARWGEEQNPVTTLAKCIRTAMCSPSSFCCPRPRPGQPPPFRYPPRLPPPDPEVAMLAPQPDPYTTWSPEATMAARVPWAHVSVPAASLPATAPLPGPTTGVTGYGTPSQAPSFLASTPPFIPGPLMMAPGAPEGPGWVGASGRVNPMTGRVGARGVGPWETGPASFLEGLSNFLGGLF